MATSSGRVTCDAEMPRATGVDVQLCQTWAMAHVNSHIGVLERAVP